MKLTWCKYFEWNAYESYSVECVNSETVANFVEYKLMKS
jgi:hypothetical protein